MLPALKDYIAVNTLTVERTLKLILTMIKGGTPEESACA